MRARPRPGARKRWLWRGLAVLLLAVLVASGIGTWRFIHWTPSRGDYPVQGIIAGGADGRTNFGAFRAIGADFAYLEASDGAHGRDPAFDRNFAAAREAGLRIGVIHRFDPCVPAERQSANFVTIVPRDASLLPPAVELDRLASDCPQRVVEAAVESELMTFLNQIEGHVGKPALLKLSPKFEGHYHIARMLDRNLWLDRDGLQPAYAGRPWTLWTANSQLRTEASEGRVRWVVVQR
jgi:lysozyme